MTGQTLGHFQILEKLGSGGMGEVYKARDNRLNRPVAVKVLPQDKVANADRKQRFIQEAQSASALNHPNIVTIYDINEENGVDYMVMEFIAGKTLDATIPRQGMRLGEALKIAIPVADGLAKAHSAGIIHRDVKPSNIMVANDGRVKILDFGLAKLIEVAVGPGDETRTERPQTEKGAILGTISYMSPEQAEGKKLDVRSDIFSFGAVLYEMLTGRRAFQGDSKVSTLSAILKDDPKPPENIQSDLEKIVRRCLRKDPARRFQGMADVKVALDEVREDSESGRFAATGAPPALRKFGWVYLAVACVVILGGALYWIIRKPSAAQQELVMTQLTRDAGLTYQPALSPDGKLLAYASDRSGEGRLDIWVQQMAGGQPVRLTSGPGDKYGPSFSPDGTKIVYSNRGDRTTSVVPALGGEPIVLARSGFFGAEYSPDGSKLAVNPSSFVGMELSFYLLPATGGTPRKVETGLKSTRFSEWSPDGKIILFREIETSGGGSGEGKEIYAVPTGGGIPVSTGLVQAFRARGVELVSRRGVRWLSDRLVAAGYAGDVVVIEEFHVQKGSWRLEGTPRRLLALPSAGIDVAATDTGPIVFSSVSHTTDIWSLHMDANAGKVLGELENLTNDAAYESEPSLSADGKRMVYVSNRTGRTEIWLRDLTTRKEKQLTANPEDKMRARISPDGAKIAYQVRGKPGYIVAREIDVHEPLTVCRDCGSPRWTPDSERITYYTGNPIVWKSLHFRSGDHIDIISHAKQVQNVRFSPDGQWLSFHLPAPGGASQIFISRTKDGKAAPEAEWIPITGAKLREFHAWWSPNGNVLYYLHDSFGDSEIVAQPLDPLTKRPKGGLISVFQPRAGLRLEGAFFVGLSMTSDRLVFTMSESKANLWKLEDKKLVQ